MNKTKIEWADYTWNPVTGCNRGCKYCYARGIANRFNYTQAWPNGFEPLLRMQRLGDPELHKKAVRIFVCSMGELFGPWVPMQWQAHILNTVRKCPQHTFIFLTKYPENLSIWNPWPANAWVGVTATDDISHKWAISNLLHVQAPIKFINFEPLHGPIDGWSNPGVDWVIIGAETGNRKGKPALNQVHKWADTIILYTKVFKIPVFLKDNLKWPWKCQEWPRST